MATDHIVVICVAIFAVAFLYSSVGHAGASGYIAVLSLAELEPSVIKPTCLALNIFVAAIAYWQFARRGHFSWRLFWPFAILAVPLAFVGGYVQISAAVFKLIVGIVLLLSAIRLLLPVTPDADIKPLQLSAAIPIGGCIGLLSGLTGTGGGIFLTPLLLMKQWATTRQAAGVSALFILFNSIAGLLGNVNSTRYISSIIIPLAIAAVVGGIAGSHFGCHRFQPSTIKRLLAAVLLHRRWQATSYRDLTATSVLRANKKVI